MKKFPKLDQYSDDDLIIIVYEDSENWQNEAVEYSKSLLIKRGITEDYGKKRIEKIREQNELLWKRELESRKIESYSVFDLLYMTFFWFKHILLDWHLNKEGYTLKRKQRLIAIGSGIVIYFISFLTIWFSPDTYEQERIAEIKNFEKNDSILKSNDDWSGKYIFIDSSTTKIDKIIWELTVKKEKSEHFCNLKLLKNKKNLTLSCIGLVKKEGFDLYPDTTYELYNGESVSCYDKLFTIIQNSDEIYTKWGKMKPFNYIKIDANDLFKKE
jgi:hypothetical protein